MAKHYKEFYETIVSIPTISTHSHHLEDETFTGFNLDHILQTSYVNWCKVKFDSSYESRIQYLEKVKYKAYFRLLQKSLMEIYGIKEELSADNWDEYNAIIAKRYEQNSNWQMEILKDICHYKKIILDAYWNPGHNNNHPELFETTFRIDPLFFGFDKDVFNNDGNNSYKLYSKVGENIDEYMEFVYNLIKSKD